MALTRTADVDDDGTGTTGTVHNNAWKTALYDAVDARWSENTTVLTGNQDNFDFSEGDYLRCNNATTITLRGLKAPASPAKPGKVLAIFSIGAGTVVLNDQDVNSTAANRVITGSSAALTLAAGTGWALVQYDATTTRWRVRGSSATVTVPNGGTGAVTLTSHGVLVGEGTGTVVATAAGSAGQALRSGGASADPSYGEVIQTTTSTGTQNDFALTAGCRLLRCNNATLLTLTGFAAGYDGQRVVIVSIGAGQVDLTNQDVLSAAANRVINVATSGATSAAPGTGMFVIMYDASTARWRLVAHEQGAPITWTPADGSGASLVFTVVTANYVRSGRRVYIDSQIVYPATANGSNAKISGLPFAAVGRSALEQAGSAVDIRLQITAAASIDILSNIGAAKTNAQMTGANFYFSGSYLSA